MKTIALFSILLFSTSIIAQAPFANIVVEEIPISEPAYSTIQSDLGGEPTTWRVSLNIPDNYELQIVFGDISTPLSLSSTTQFYQHPAGGPSTLQVNSTMYDDFPALVYDSWFTIGYEDLLGNLEILIPDANAFDDWENGNNILFNDIIGGGIFIPTVGYFPQNSPDAEGNILVLQLTSDGTITGCLNVQIRRLNPDGTVYDPPGEDTSEVVLFSDICFTANGISNSCLTDFNNSGNVGSEDLLIFLPAMGCIENCIIDPSGDGETTSLDLLILLAEFGQSCY